MRNLEEEIKDLHKKIDELNLELMKYQLPGTAYQEGREHEQNCIVNFINNWTGDTNSEFGRILSNKFKEMTKRH